MVAKRHYSDRERAAALAVLDANAGNYSAAARAAGVPRLTLREWDKARDNASPLDIQQESKKTLAELFEGEIRAAVEAADAKRGAASYKDLGVVVGILSDKLANLSEAPVTRIDVTSGGERILTPDAALAIIAAHDAKR